MRELFIKWLYLEAKNNNNWMLLVGDLGFGLVEKFKNDLPNQFFNAGIAEQNMASVAAGMASEGDKVFLYSIGNFPTFRCAEQIRNDICYHDLDVTIVCFGAGLGYGSLGYSHHAIEDLSFVRSMKNMSICSPCNIYQLSYSLSLMTNNFSPKYLRLSKNTLDDIEPISISDNACVFKSNEDSTILVLPIGNTLKEAFMIAGKFDGHSDIISINFWGIKYEKELVILLKKYKKVITIEDHLKTAGFGSYISEIIVFNALKIEIEIMGYEKDVVGMVGDEDNIRKLTNFAGCYGN